MGGAALAEQQREESVGGARSRGSRGRGKEKSGGDAVFAGQQRLGGGEERRKTGSRGRCSQTKAGAGRGGERRTICNFDSVSAKLYRRYIDA